SLARSRPASSRSSRPRASRLRAEGSLAFSLLRSSRSHRPRSGPSIGRLEAGLHVAAFTEPRVAYCTARTIGGSAQESNLPKTAELPRTGFEDRGPHQRTTRFRGGL